MNVDVDVDTHKFVIHIIKTNSTALSQTGSKRQIVRTLQVTYSTCDGTLSRAREAHMQLIDALVTVANRHHTTWALTVDDIVLLRRSAGEGDGAAYVVRLLTDPPEQMWTAVITTPIPGEMVTATLEEALSQLIAAGRRETVLSDRWLVTAHGAA